jgi:hypothetical protein
MDESVKTEDTIREYLLGRVADETTLEQIEEQLFTDEEFCSQVELAEDGLINDYVLGQLDHADQASLKSTLDSNADRRFKLELTQALREKALAKGVKVLEEKPSFFASLQSFFRQPQYAGAFAVLLVAVLISVVYFSRRSAPDQLAELRSIYQQARPTETRISEFGYAPLSQLRGAPEDADRNRLRRIENNLIEATEKTPNAQTFHALGVFRLTQQDYNNAVKEFDSALKFDDRNAKIHNDLGAAFFELAKVSKEKRLEYLSQALEEFSKATELNSNLLEALFNKSLVLQELDMPREARDSWTLYLEKDPSSPWAAEARKHLDQLKSRQPPLPSNDQVLSDFLLAYGHKDEARAKQIHDETKGLLKSVTVPLQLSQKYLEARQRGDAAAAKESLDAMTFIGRVEREQNSEFFFLS